MPVNKKSLQLLLLVLLGFLAYRFFSTPAESISEPALPWTGFIVVGILLLLSVLLAFAGARARKDRRSEVDQEKTSD